MGATATPAAIQAVRFSESANEGWLMDLSNKVRRLLGRNFPGQGFVDVVKRGRSDCYGWVLEDLSFQNVEGEAVPAFFLRPPEQNPPVPALVYCHAHGNLYSSGRQELLEGRPALLRPYAMDLVQLGIAVLCIEMPCFGARQNASESSLAKALLWQGETLFGLMLAEQAAGVDFLASHPAVRADRIGALGFSMGSTLAWWLTALDKRIHSAAVLCSFADLETLVRIGAHDGHGLYMTVPGLLSVARSGVIAGLAAPRALQICVGLKDWSTPKQAFTVGRRDLQDAYDTVGAPAKLSFHVEPDTGHRETSSMREAVLTFLRRELC